MSRPLLGTASPSPGCAGSHLHVGHGELGAEAGDAADGIARLLVLWEAVPPIHGGVRASARVLPHGVLRRVGQDEE